MNFLAHLHLAGVRAGGGGWHLPCGATLIGNLLPDLVRGRYRGPMPDPMAAGYRRHVCVDGWTDVSPGFLESRARVRDHLGGVARRFSGVVVDVLFDHCLTLAWGRWCPLPLQVFQREAYGNIAATLGEEPDLLPRATVDTLQRFATERWLTSYTTEAGLAVTFERMGRRYSQRFRRTVDLSAVMDAWQAERAALRAGFNTVYGELTERLQAGRDAETPPTD